MSGSRAPRRGNSHEIPGSDSDETYGAYSRRSRRAHGRYQPGSEGDGGDHEYFSGPRSDSRQPGYSGSLAGEVIHERARRRGNDRQSNNGIRPSERPRHDHHHPPPLSDLERDEDDYSFEGGARNRGQLGHRRPHGSPGDSIMPHAQQRGARNSHDNFGSDSVGASADEADDDAWGPPDESPASFAYSDDDTDTYGERNKHPPATRRRPDHSMQNPSGRSSHNRRKPDTSASPAPAPSTGRERPSTRALRGDRHVASATGSSNRQRSIPASPTSDISGDELDELPVSTANDSEEELLKAIELSKLPGDDHFRQQQREQDEQIERLLQESKEEARAAEVRKRKQQKRLLQEQERQEQEAIEASRAIAEADDRKRAAKENAFIEESRREARAKEREREWRQMEEAEKENAILEASRREIEAKEEEELARILEQSRLEAQSGRGGGGLAVSQFAARQGMGNAAIIPNAAPVRDTPVSPVLPRENHARQTAPRGTALRGTPASTSINELGASDEDMEEIMRQIAEIEARQARAEQEFGGTSASSSGPNTAAQIEAENEAQLRAALAQSLDGDEAPRADPDEGDLNPPPMYGEAPAPGETTVVVGAIGLVLSRGGLKG